MPRKQSTVATEYRIDRGRDVSYLLQDITKNALLGISPIANRHIFMCYHSPTFVYGLDTLRINKTDMDRLEIMYRSELKRMQAFPVHTTSPIIYLTIGILPAQNYKM